jgi:hypothetical protein
VQFPAPLLAVKQILHVLTREKDALARDIIARQQEHQETRIDVVDLTVGPPDYSRLLEQIFTADSVQVW